MSMRIVLAAVMAAVFTVNLNASGRFGWRVNKRTVTPSKQSQLYQLPTSPEKLTELYGPSILIRTPKATNRIGTKARIVTQPGW